MSTQEQANVREPLLKANRGPLRDDEIDEPAGGTRRIDYEQTYRKRHGFVQTHRSNERQKQRATNRRGFFRGVWQ
jgi:hypothetical protein